MAAIDDDSETYCEESDETTNATSNMNLKYYEFSKAPVYSMASFSWLSLEVLVQRKAEYFSPPRNYRVNQYIGYQ